MQYIFITALYVLVFCGAMPDQFEIRTVLHHLTLESQVQITLGSRICVRLFPFFCFAFVMSQSQFKGVPANV